jgi:integrase
MKVSLTDAWLRAAKAPATGRIEVRDAKVPGLVVRVTATGAISWAARGRRQDGREARVTLGTWPEVTLSEARRRAQGARAAIADGADPVRERREMRAAREVQTKLPTVADRLAEWQTANEGRWSGRYSREVSRLCTHDIVPALGSRPLAEVNRQAWTSLLASVAQRSVAVGAMLYRTVSSFCGHAEAHGWIVEHPLPRRGAAKIAPSVASRDRVLTDDELQRVWAATETMRPRPRAFVRLLLTTGCRAGEAAGIAVGELDAASGLWRLPAQRSKNRKPHVMPIPGPLLADLVALTPHGVSGEYRLLGHVKGGALSGFSKVKARVDEASGVTGWRFHDLRRTVRTRLAALGVAPDIAERALNHVSAVGALVQVYDRHDYQTEILAALRQWQGALGVLVGKTAAGAEVVPLRSGAG